MGTKKEVEGYDEDSGDENINDGSSSDSDSENESGTDEKKDEANDSEDEKLKEKIQSKKQSSGTPTSSSSSTKKKESTSSTMKNNTKSNSRVSFGGIDSLLKPAIKLDLKTLGFDVRSSEEEGWLELVLSYPAISRRLLMVQLG